MSWVSTVLLLLSFSSKEVSAKIIFRKSEACAGTISYGDVSHTFFPLFPFCSPLLVKSPYSSFSGFAHLSAGLSCGLSGLGAGLAIGIVGDAGVRANGIQPKLFVPMVLILIFAEALGLYGLIVGIILSQQTQPCTVPKLPAGY